MGSETAKIRRYLPRRASTFQNLKCALALDLRHLSGVPRFDLTDQTSLLHEPIIVQLPLLARIRELNVVRPQELWYQL